MKANPGPANPGELRRNIEDLFACWEREGFSQVAHTYEEKVERNHGRRERRQSWVITAPEELAYADPHGQWTSLRAVARVSYERQRRSAPGQDTRYYICSYPAQAEELLRSTRDHWCIENSLHWVLDVAFVEDHSRARTGHSDQNLAVVRRLALNLLKQEQSAKVGIKAKRKKAGWDYDYLLRVLSH